MAMRARAEEIVFPNAAGLDVGASFHWVAVPRHATDDPVREFGAMTDDLNAMADRLLACGVEQAFDESRSNFLAQVLCLMIGTAALPQVLMRYYTTPSVREARAARSPGRCSSSCPDPRTLDFIESVRYPGVSGRRDG